MRFAQWFQDWTSQLVLVAATAAVLFGLWWGLSDVEILPPLRDTNAARGLITFLFSVGTVGVFLILIAAVLVSGDEKKFAQGKDVLTLLLGIFGTIIGFYFGSPETSPIRSDERQVVVHVPVGPDAPMSALPHTAEPASWSPSRVMHLRPPLSGLFDGDRLLPAGETMLWDVMKQIDGTLGRTAFVVTLHVSPAGGGDHELSERRAAAIKRWFILHAGVPPESVLAMAPGGLRPASHAVPGARGGGTTHWSGGQAENVELIIVPVPGAPEPPRNVPAVMVHPMQLARVG
jgi:hypothetical protein